MTSLAAVARLTRGARLGVRFRDPVLDQFVSSGLAVEAYPEGSPERRSTAVLSRSGVFTFRNLPRTRPVEAGDGDEAFRASEAPRYPFVLEVRDLESRYLPFRLDLQLPARRRAAAAAESLPLFSSPARLPPRATGILRAEIRDAATGEPAAWALLEAKGLGQAVNAGLADAQGRVMLPLGCPRMVTVEFTVRYRRRWSAPAIPDLADVLTQPAATVWQDTARTTAWTEETLPFGRDLVLASRDGTGAATPALLITPADSPA